MILRAVPAALALCCAAAGSAQSIAPTTETTQRNPAAGLYDGGQMEIAAMLELGEDGRYRYQLSYGALDEWSAGTWVADGEGVMLTSDAFNAPRFEIAAAEGAEEGTLTVRMASTNGIDPQYFALSLVRASGAVAIESMGAQGATIAMGKDPVVSLAPVLPMLDLRGPQVPVAATGAALRISFTPNDLGFVGFNQERLNRVTDTYDLVRHGRTLQFRKVDRER